MSDNFHYLKVTGAIRKSEQQKKSPILEKLPILYWTKTHLVFLGAPILFAPTLTLFVINVILRK